MFERYAIFYTPADGLAAFGARWLGWDSAVGQFTTPPVFDGIDVAKITETPRKYGIHATLKAPFRIADGCDLEGLQSAAANFAANHGAVDLGPMELRYESGFIALRPAKQPAALSMLAGDIVRHFDTFRAPLSEADIARRRKSPLTARQDQQMLEWGYPYIFEDFRFHITLSGALPSVQAVAIRALLEPMVRPFVADPFLIEAITVMGQDREGMFHQIHRYTLTG